MIPQTLVQFHADRAPLQVLGSEVRFLCRDTDTAGRFSMMEVMLPLGAGPPLHHHDWDEAYYIADGEVQFQLGSKTHRVRAGDFVYAPAGALHAFQGVSQTPARVLILDADLQDPPELLGDMMKIMDRGADVVYGQRRQRPGESWFKLASASFFYRLLDRMT